MAEGRELKLFVPRGTNHLAIVTTCASDAGLFSPTNARMQHSLLEDQGVTRKGRNKYDAAWTVRHWRRQMPVNAWLRLSVDKW